jgi:signal transduction histidine kinase
VRTVDDANGASTATTDDHGVAALERALRTIRAGHRVLLEATDEDELTGRMCRAIVEAGGYALAWVGMAEHDEERHVRMLAAAGRVEYVEPGMVTWHPDDERGRGPTGRALRSGEVQATHDLAEAADFEPWRARALAAGFRSSLAVPLDWVQGTRATISIYALEPGAFDGAAIELLTDLAADLAFGARRLNELAALHEEEAQRLRLERQLMNAERLDTVGRLASAVAHDFNNLLTVIQAAAELARDAAESGDSPSGELDAILAATAQAHGLTQRLLTLGRRDHAGPLLVDVATAIDRLSDLIDRVIGPTVSCRLDLASGLPPVWIDLGRLEQLVLNLVGNAVDAIGETGRGSGTIELGVRPVTTEGRVGGTPVASVLLEVRDDGAGMSASVIAQALEPFFTTKAPGRGTGLGLATVHDTVRASGGTMSIDSTPGVGTTIRIVLPGATA